MINESGWVWDVPNCLSQEKQTELAIRSRNGDAEARTRLVMSNLRLVLHIVSSMSCHPDQKNDLVGEGLVGAWIAACRFDPSRGVHFATYASWWIKSCIIYYIKKDCKTRGRAKAFTLRRELDKIYAETGLGLEDDAIAKRLSKKFLASEKTLRRKLSESNVVNICLDSPVDCDGDECLVDRIASDEVSPEESYENVEIAKTTKRAMSVLSPKEAEVIRITFLKNGTLQDAGARFGVTKQRAEQICKRALRKMRIRLEQENFHEACA